MTYDAQGHRIRLVETPAAGASPVITTDFSYEGDRVVREVSTSSAGPIVTRTFTTDEAGAILKMTVVTTGGGSTADDGTYLVTYNGHGDAISLAEIDPTTGVLTTAARVSYSTWGTPSVSTQNGYANLGFRYLYVGRFDVQWDDFSSAGLLYMHARHYQPEFGRFLQPDPSAAETNLYAYAENSPITKIDPSGLAFYTLTPAEKRRCSRYPSQCDIFKKYSAMVQVYTDWKYSDRQIRNAMRHCMWQSMLRWKLGWWAATAWGAAHEDGSTNVTDTKLDWHNNYVGRLLGGYGGGMAYA